MCSFLVIHATLKLLINLPGMQQRSGVVDTANLLTSLYRKREISEIMYYERNETIYVS